MQKQAEPDPEAEDTRQEEEFPGFILERTAKRMKQFFQQQLNAAEVGITIDQWIVLQVIARAGGMYQHEIAAATFKDPPTVTRIIDLLVEKKLINRLADTDDRRRFRIQLTRTGVKKIEEVSPVIKAARRQAWDGFEEKQCDSLVYMLNQIFENLNG